MVQAPPKPKWGHGNGFDLRPSDGASRECKGRDDCKDPREKQAEPKRWGCQCDCGCRTSPSEMPMCAYCRNGQHPGQPNV